MRAPLPPGVYRRTQTGGVPQAIVALTLLFGLAAVRLSGLSGQELLPATVGMILGAAVGLACSSMTVEVNRRAVELWFGPGLARQRFPLTDLARTERVSLSPLAGFGARRTPRGWLYRVGGTGALALEWRSGRRVLIGTDDPLELEEVVLAALARSRAGA